jgi:peroxiredoxin
MLTLRQLIPPLTARTPDGKTVRAGDYKQKKNLLIAFLHSDCPLCEKFAHRIDSKAEQLAEYESVALLISLEPAKWGLVPRHSVVLASDRVGRAAQEYLGADAFGGMGLSRVGLFLTDRYGELFAQWEARDCDGLPPLAEALKTLAYVQIRCEC